MHRSWLFVPGDSERKLEKSLGVGADAIILDLEDAVAPARKDAARRIVAEFLAGPAKESAASVYVRVNPWSTSLCAEDLETVMASAPVGIVQPKSESAQDVIALGAAITAQENQHGIERGSTRILPIVTETPKAVFQLGSYTVGVPRLVGLTWGAEDLGAAIGASARRDEHGEWLQPYEMVRSLTLFAAHAAGVEAIDTLHADFRDAEGLRAHARRARQSGFTGKLAIHPAQVAVIHEAMTPSDDEVAKARLIVAAFEEFPEAGAVSLAGQMLDRPHLEGAHKVLALASRSEGT
ncbi:MAG: CoA ester lyase [Gammaproteobacteria bacterium]